MKNLERLGNGGKGYGTAQMYKKIAFLDILSLYTEDFCIFRFK